MGFGLLLLGYMTTLSFFPDLSAIFLYIGYTIFIPVIGGFIILAAFFKLQEYNIYFKIMKYITIVYILALIGFAPFFMIEQSYEIMERFIFISRIINISVLFTFHYFMLSGIYNLAKNINNERISRSARFNIYFTYVYFGLTAASMIFINVYYAYALVVLGLVYFFRNMLCIYKCFMQITYKGHDEEIERKYEEKNRRKKNKK